MTSTDFDDELDPDVFDDGRPACSVCGEPKFYVDCPECGGEGYWDETDIDPLEGDEFTPCAMCGAKGGWYECGNVQKHFSDRQKATS